MRKGKQTSIYLSEDMAPLVAKAGAGMAAGVTATMERYFSLLQSTIARIEKEYAAEIPILAKVAPFETWREAGLRGAVLHLVEDTDIEGIDREDMTDRLSGLTLLESYALGEAIERAAR